MTHDDLEFSISQYLDGTLAPAERDALETRLGSDAEARALYAEYESLQGALADAPLPPVRWDRLADQISAAVAREPEPAQSYRLSGWLRPARLALAASVLVVGAITFSLFNSSPTNTGVTHAVAPIRIVVKPSPEAGAATAVARVVNVEPVQVAVSAAGADGDQGLIRVYADSVVHRPSKAVIVSAAPVGQDSLLTPF
jgi:anti-sigma factor RsiW